MTKEEIEQFVKSNDVVLFMKGTPQFPQCGFSQRAAAILRASGVEDFAFKDVLEDDELRQNIKEFSQWPTIPQLYIRGEFIGGCDIMMEMYQANELKTLLFEIE
jgi:monothiol glutaredoxin